MDSKQILSVGIDIGTSTSQLVFSRLELRNRAATIWIRRFLKCALPSLLRAGRPYRRKWPPNPPPSSSNTSEPPILHRFLLNPRTIPKSHHIPPRRKRTRPARRGGRDSEMDKKQVRPLPLKRERLPSEKRSLKTDTPDVFRPGCLFSKTAPRGQGGHHAPLAAGGASYRMV